jgi:salicylate hydroxylase
MAKRLKVAIVGGGIGGLSTANAMVRDGHEVHVFEQAKQLGEVGAGVMIAPNSVRLLERLGFRNGLERLGGRIAEGSSYRRMDGSVVGPVMTSDSSGENGAYGMHRADLLNMLADHLPESTVNTGHKCVGIEQDPDMARLTFENGRTVEADVVVAADGIHSQLRERAVEPTPPVFSGMVAYRGLVSRDQLPSWRNDVHMVWMGEGKHFMVFPVRGGEMLNFVGFLPSGYPAEESWAGKGDVNELVKAFAGWDPLVTQLIGQVKNPFWWGLFDREPLERWTFGRLVLLGDAAHAMLPHLGQGANQAIEDGVALSALLSQVDPALVSEALARYEQVRKPRATKVQLGSRANGNRYDSRYDDLAQRDAEIANAADFRKWLYDYDVEKHLGPSEQATA